MGGPGSGRRSGSSGRSKSVVLSRAGWRGESKIGKIGPRMTGGAGKQYATKKFGLGGKRGAIVTGTAKKRFNMKNKSKMRYNLRILKNRNK